jgi:hypothetical protein
VRPEPAKATRQTDRLQWTVAVLLLATVLLAANRRLVSGADCPTWDADQFFAPFQMLVADHARAGTFLLWNPWLNGGSPDYAEPQVGSFSPVAVILGFLTGGTEAGFRVYWLTIWAWGGVGVILLGRHLGAPAWGACAIALGFTFSGFWTGHAEHTSTLYAIAWLPSIVWRLDVALATHRLKPAVEAGALWGLSALGGYPAWVLLNACFAMLWAVGRWCCPERSQSRAALKHVATMLAAMALVGLVILLPPYVAFMVEGSSYSDRAGALTREVAVESNALHPGSLTTFASPYLSILKVEGNPTLWEYTDVSTSSVYLGVIVPVVALVALFGGRGDRWRLWLTFIVLLFIGCALAKSLPLRGWLYDFVPPTRYFRHAGFFRAYAMFGAVVLALLGARDMASTKTSAAPRISLAVAVLACLTSAAAFVAYYAVFRSVVNHGSKFALANWHIWSMWPGVAAILLMGSFICRSPRTTAGSSFIVVRYPFFIFFVPASLMALGITDALLTANLSTRTISEGGNCRASWTRVSSNHRASLDLMPSGLQREFSTPDWATYPGNIDNKNLPLKIATLANYAPFGDRFHFDLIQRPTLVSMAIGNNRTWFSRTAAIVHPTDASYAAFVGRTEQLGQPVLVVHRRDWLLSRTRPAVGQEIHVLDGRGASGTGVNTGTPGETGPNDNGDVAAIRALPAAERANTTLRAYSPSELKLEVFCPSVGWVLVTDRWARGWRATVNGKPTEVWGGNFIFRALPVQQGRNEIRFEYHPVGYPALVVLSWMTIAVVIFWTVWPKRSM